MTDQQNYNKIPAYDDEKVVSSSDYVKNVFKNPKQRSISYLRDLFPVIEWFPHYPSHWQWVLSDLITGITVAIVLVPQSMSYAKLANLSPEFGLYSAFIGALFYFFFATSREICIGPVAVLSTEVGKIIVRFQNKYGDEYSPNEIATTLALICGGIVLGLGLLRLGFIVEFISLPAIMAFTTGSAFNIVCGQLAGLMGFNKKAGKHSTTYQTLIAFLKHLPDTKVDAAFGLVDLFILYLWQFVLERLIKKYEHKPKIKLMLNYILNIRTAVVIVISTCISFGVLRYHPHKEKTPYSIIGTIPSGLNHVGRFVPQPGLATKLASELPICTIVLVLEHISISKSFARINGYRVNPDQEFIAIGFTNMIGTFFGAYPVTGSFSRTALSAKCGVKTPFKAAFTGACVLLATYCFTDGFYYIPSATLCAIIIHCVTGLLASYKLTTKLYMFSPVDFIIFIVGVFITVFATIEDGIYWAMCASAAQLLWRMCITNGTFMGRVKVAKISNPILQSNVSINNGINEGEDSNSEYDSYNRNKLDSVNETSNIKTLEIDSVGSLPNNTNSNDNYVYKWVPLPNESFNPSFVHTSYINNQINVENPPTGVLVYRMAESFIYTNCSAQIDQIIGKVRKSFRPHDSSRERLWCEYSLDEKDWSLDIKNWKMDMQYLSGLKHRIFSSKNHRHDNNHNSDSGSEDYQLHVDKVENDIKLPELRVLHLDFSQVVGTDATSIQSLIDLKNTITNYVGTNWELHFSGIINPWVIRSLVNSGFAGNIDKEGDELINNYLDKSVKPLLRISKRYSDNENSDETNIVTEKQFNGDLELGVNGDGSKFPLHNTNFPRIFMDIPTYSEYE